MAKLVATDIKDAVVLDVPDEWREFSERCVFRCYGCLGWRIKEAHDWCPECGSPWQKIIKLTPEESKRVEEIVAMRKPLTAKPLQRVCSNWHDCHRELPPGHREPYCDFCSGC